MLAQRVIRIQGRRRNHSPAGRVSGSDIKAVRDRRGDRGTALRGTELTTGSAPETAAQKRSEAYKCSRRFSQPLDTPPDQEEHDRRGAEHDDAFVDMPDMTEALYDVAQDRERVVGDRDN